MKENKGHFINLIEGRKREKIQLTEREKRHYQAGTKEEKVNVTD